MDNDASKYYVVFSRWLAIELIKRLFKCTNIAPHKTQEGMVVFYFKETSQLHKAMRELTNK